jgi:glycosyltransferase involved in cell wall biosynthesis
MTLKNGKNSIILSLDPRGIIINGGADVISRQNIYGQQLESKSKNLKTKFVIFTSGNRIDDYEEFYYVNISRISKPTFNPLLFARKSLQYITRNDLDVRLLIVGDPWESYWSAYFLNKFLNKKISIQIQAHGDIADPRWRRINYRNKIRYLLAKLSLPKASSVRVVNKYQAENLVKAFGIKREKIVVIPVPINILGKATALKSVRPKTIGLIGRIHKDRGIWEFIKLVRILNISSKDFKVIVIGDGPSKDRFLLKLSSVITKNRIIYLGQLPESELSKAWKRIGVLVSMAPVESYGRVMRESLVAGVPVWATASAGVKDLINNCKKGEVKLLDLSKSSSSLGKDFNSLHKTKVSSDFSKKFIEENNTYAAKLANSWINIINKAK